MYNKLYGKIVNSSIWLEATPTRIVWITCIALMDQDGLVQMASVANMAHTARVSLAEAEEAIAALESPDPLAPEQEYEGRRLERVHGGWIVLNAPIYQRFASGEKIREQNRERAKAYRERHRAEAITHVTRDAVTSNAPSRKVTASGSGSGSNQRGSPSEIPVPQAGPVERIFGHWKETFQHPRANLDPKRRKLIASALNLFSEADLCAAIAGYKLSPHHMGQNDRSTVYDDIGLILRDTAHIEAGLGFYRTPPPKLSEVEQARAELRNAGVTHGQQSNGSVGSSLGPIRLGLDPPFRKISPG